MTGNPIGQSPKADMLARTEMTKEQNQIRPD